MPSPKEAAQIWKNLMTDPSITLELLEYLLKNHRREIHVEELTLHLKKTENQIVHALHLLISTKLYVLCQVTSSILIGVRCSSVRRRCRCQSAATGRYGIG